jgi:hypothetical protein
VGGHCSLQLAMVLGIGGSADIWEGRDVRWEISVGLALEEELAVFWGRDKVFGWPRDHAVGCLPWDCGCGDGLSGGGMADGGCPAEALGGGVESGA